MKKKGEMSLEFTFLIFLAVIVVMVVVTLIIKFAFSGNMLFCKLAGTCNKDAPPAPDNQVINMSLQPCDKVQTELVKHSKLCHERWLELASREQTICYSILSPGACPFTALDIESALLADNVNASMIADPGDTKFVVTFVRDTRSITIV